MILEVFLHHKHRVAEPGQQRGRGGPGGWVWATSCRCGWKSWTSPSPDSVEEQITMHLHEDETMLDILDDRGFFTVSYVHFYTNGKTRGFYLIQMGRWDV